MDDISKEMNEAMSKLVVLQHLRQQNLLEVLMTTISPRESVVGRNEQVVKLNPLPEEEFLILFEKTFGKRLSISIFPDFELLFKAVVKKRDGWLVVFSL